MIGKNVTYWREKKGISQAALARIVGVSSAFISYVEAGERIPGRDALIRIARALDVPVPALLEGYEPETVKPEAKEEAC